MRMKRNEGRKIIWGFYFQQFEALLWGFVSTKCLLLQVKLPCTTRTRSRLECEQSFLEGSPRMLPIPRDPEASRWWLNEPHRCWATLMPSHTDAEPHRCWALISIITLMIIYRCHCVSAGSVNGDSPFPGIYSGPVVETVSLVTQ